MKTQQIVTRTLRSFARSEWHGLEGCESFSDGSAPLIGEAASGYLIVLDATGLSALRETEDGCYQEQWSLFGSGDGRRTQDGPEMSRADAVEYDLVAVGEMLLNAPALTPAVLQALGFVNVL